MWGSANDTFADRLNTGKAKMRVSKNKNKNTKQKTCKTVETLGLNNWKSTFCGQKKKRSATVLSSPGDLGVRIAISACRFIECDFKSQTKPCVLLYTCIIST